MSKQILPTPASTWGEDVRTAWLAAIAAQNANNTELFDALGIVGTNVNLGTTKLIRSGDYVYLRSRWSDDYSCIQIVRVTDTTAWGNGVVNILSSGLVPVATADADVPTTAFTTYLRVITDDSTPILINDTYIGANHGCSGVLEVTATGHGKTAVDVGSTWTDATPTTYTLLRVVDANKLWVISTNTGTGGDWTWDTSINGATLTHAAGATHTTAITVGSSALSQLKPALKDHTVSVLLGGVTPVTVDGVYDGSFFDVVEEYDIIDVPALIAYVQANVGDNPAPDWTDASIADVARVQITYRYSENGSCTVTQTVTALKDLKLGYIGLIQGQALVPAVGGGTLWEYIPKMASFTIGANTYDLTACNEITALPDDLELTTARWASAVDPPDRFVQYTKSAGGVKQITYSLGYNPRIGLGVPATRASMAASAALIASSSRKTYPKLATGVSTAYPDSMVDAGTSFSAVAFRCLTNPVDYPNATAVCWYYVGTDCYVNVDYHTAVSEFVAMPAHLVGASVEVVESSGLLLDTPTVLSDGIHVTVSGTYGYAILRLHGGGAPVTGGTLITTGTAETDLPAYGANVLSTGAWTSAGWTGDATAGWDHTTGNTTALSNAAAAVVATKYQIAYAVSGRTAGTFTVTFGGQSQAGMSASGSFAPTATAVTGLVVTPTTDFDGAIVITVKAIVDTASPSIAVKDSNGSTRTEVRAGGGPANTFLGLNSGQYATTGGNNSGLGYNALANVTTGSYNVGIGRNALAAVTVGNNNIGIGYGAGDALTTANYSIALGYNALGAGTTASYSVMVGFAAGAAITTGNYNVGIGMDALGAMTTASNSIGLGYKAGAYETAGSKVFIDGMDRANEADGRTKSLFYAVLNADPALQTLALNAITTILKLKLNTAYLPDHADDTAAAAGGVGIGEAYRTGSILKVRIA